MKRNTKTFLLAIASCLILLTPGALANCVECEGSSCVMNPWTGHQRCRTLSGGGCQTILSCGGNVPNPDPDPPIVVAMMQIFGDGGLPFGAPMTTPGGTTTQMRSRLADITERPSGAFTLKDAALEVGYSIPGDRHDAVTVGKTGFVYAARALDRDMVELRVCSYDAAGFTEIGRGRVRSGDAFMVGAELEGEPTVIVFQVEILDGQDAPTRLRTVQQDLWSDLWKHRSASPWSMRSSTAPQDCGF